MEAKNQNPQEQAQLSVAQSTPLWLICLICIAFSLLSAVATFYVVTNYAASQKIALVDMNGLMKIKLAMLQQSPTADMKAIESDALAFSAALKNQFAAYGANGVLLINSQAALNKPAGIEDITDQVAEKVGLKVPK